MATKSETIREALDRIYHAIGGNGAGNGIEHPNIANGPIEHVLAFNNDEHIALEGPDNAPYFSSHGPLTDLQGNVLPGTRVATTFPVDPTKFDQTGLWPPEQDEPFDEPPVDPAETNVIRNSKQAYYFNDDEDSFVTAGPSIPKITRTKNGGAQFWVGSIGLIAQGTGKYEGARGVATYVGSGYFDSWPETFKEQISLLRAGFKALVGTYAKIVLKDDQGEELADEEAGVQSEDYDSAIGEAAPEQRRPPSRGSKRGLG
ncbi:MAG TPA: hypothetical protein VKA78_15585 [Pyrinomonadaceae bacterium]|nr:hypothetical protein [Pyrinomonadaceae bacterium]